LNKNSQPRLERGSGILLHITSLYGDSGVGNLGNSTTDFIRFLKKAGQKYWQILPLGPVSSGYSYSPYASHSSFAGNQMLIDPVSLQDEAWMKSDILAGSPPPGETRRINFREAEFQTDTFLGTAWENFNRYGSKSEKEQFRKFCIANTHWLDDFALFKALSEINHSFNWRSWDPVWKDRDSIDLKALPGNLKGRMDQVRFEQYLFDIQWNRFKTNCNANGIRLIGDIPIYVGMDSADTWANPSLFRFNDDFSPEAVSGVPPDYFSETGQKWGNPLYRWFTEKGVNIHLHKWWEMRLLRLFSLVDIVRIDHFRGFESFWSVDTESPDGRGGRWEKGPGYDLFDHLFKTIGNMPVIAEDLGIITDEVHRLRERTGFPGMKILQFAFGGGKDNPYLPENITDPNCVIYTGTHDNNTSIGWFRNETGHGGTHDFLQSYLEYGGEDEFLWKFINCAVSSAADLSIVPLQDIAGLGEEARLNTPGTSGDQNWSWRAAPKDFSDAGAEKLKKLCIRAGRAS